MNTADSRSPAVLLAFACVYIIWGTTFLGIAIAIETLPPFTSGAIRFLLAALLMYGWLRLRGARPLEGVNWRHAALCGVLLTGFGNGLVVWAQQGVPSGIAALVVASIPVFVLAFDWLFFSKRAPGVAAVIGVAVAAIGVAAIVSNTRALAGGAQPLHIAALLCAVCAWSVGTLLQKRLLRGDIFAFTCAQIFFGGVLQGALALMNGEWRIFDIDKVSASSVVAVLYLIVFGSVVTFSCYAWLLSRVPAQKVATYAVVNPVVAVLLGALVLNEPITGLVIGAVVLVLLGVSLVLFQGSFAAIGKRLRAAPIVTDPGRTQ